MSIGFYFQHAVEFAGSCGAGRRETQTVSLCPPPVMPFGLSRFGVHDTLFTWDHARFMYCLFIYLLPTQ